MRKPHYRYLYRAGDYYFFAGPGPEYELVKCKIKWFWEGRA